MRGRHGASRVRASRARRWSGALGARVGLVSASLAVGAMGLADTAVAPETPRHSDVSALPGRDAADTSRSAERDDVVPGDLTSKLVGSPGKNFAQPQATPEPQPPDPDVKPKAGAPLPADSGSGHRVVYDIAQQQVWLVDGNDTVVRNYAVSGSRFDQQPTGTFEVFSKSREAVSWHLTETMEYMVRFHRGENSNIGFHDIPVEKESGDEVQTASELGTPLSDGCIRQAEDDAVALWEHTEVGTPVVVVST